MAMSFRLPPAPRLLQHGASAWFIAAVIGQWAFVAFILLFYGGHGLSGDLAALNDKPPLTGYVPGGCIGSAQFLGPAMLGRPVPFDAAWQPLPALASGHELKSSSANLARSIRRRWRALSICLGRDGKLQSRGQSRIKINSINERSQHSTTVGRS